MICKAKGCNRDTEFDVDEWCNYHWKIILLLDKIEDYLIANNIGK